jgi:hypothetical protein
MSGSKIPVNANTQGGLTPTLKSNINNALIAHNAIPKIHAALLHECQASGFTASLRARALELLRSGECNKFGEVLDRIMLELKPDSENGRGSVNGNSKGNGDNNTRLKIPDTVVKEGVRIVREAIDPVISVVLDE